MKNGPWQPSIRWIFTGTQLCLLWSLILWRPLLPVHFVGFPGASAGKESTCNVEDLGSIPGLGRSPGEGKGYPLQYSGLGNSRNCRVHRVYKKNLTWLSDFHFQRSLQSISNSAYSSRYTKCKTDPPEHKPTHSPPLISHPSTLLVKTKANLSLLRIIAIDHQLRV